jgi:hypothetical protein
MFPLYQERNYCAFTVHLLCNLCTVIAQTMHRQYKVDTALVLGGIRVVL